LDNNLFLLDGPATDASLTSTGMWASDCRPVQWI